MALSSKAPAEGSWGKFIPPDYPWLQWSGRVDFRKKSARFDWAQVSVKAEFEGDACAVYLDPVDNNFNLFVDGELKAILGTRPLNKDIENYSLWKKPKSNGVHIWVLDGLGKGRHRLELNKRTGANFNIAKFYGLRLDQAAVLHKPAPAPSRRIEFIGDSLTNAYGCEAPARECAELRPYENSWKSYAALSARALNAQAQVLALSGYGVVRNYGEKKKTSPKPMPFHYQRVISGEDEILWDRSKFKPDAIVVNLGTNDFSTEPVPDATTFLNGYMDLLDQALEGRRKTPVFLISVKGRLIQEQRTAEALAWAKDKKIDATLVEFEAAGDHELGCDWHPQAVVHERWAKVLTQALKSHLNW